MLKGYLGKRLRDCGLTEDDLSEHAGKVTKESGWLVVRIVHLTSSPHGPCGSWGVQGPIQ
jgi:hypothetical protein